MKLFSLYRVAEGDQLSHWEDQFWRCDYIDETRKRKARAFGWGEICTGNYREITGFRKLLRERYGNKNPPLLEQLQFMWEVFKQEKNGSV